MGRAGQPFAAFASLSIGNKGQNKGLSNGRVSPVLRKRPPVPTGSGSSLHVVLGVWSRVGRFEEEGIHLWSAARNEGEVGKLRGAQ